MAARKRKLQPRKAGAWRDWANIPDDIFLEPMDPEDLDAAEGLHSDEWGITLPEKLPKQNGGRS